MDRPPVAHHLSTYGAATDRDGVADRQGSAQRSVLRHQAQVLPFETEDRGIRRPAHPRGILGDGLHDRLEIGRRARDHPQDLGRGGLLLQRLGHLSMGLCERSVLLLQFREQPHVLDRDHRLVGEGLQELDLLRWESDLGVTHHDRPDGSSLPQHGDAQDSAKIQELREAPSTGGTSLSGVLDMNHSTVQHRQTCDRVTARGPAEELFGHSPRRRCGVVRGNLLKPFAVEPIDARDSGVAEVDGALQDRVEDRLHVGRRATDDTKDLARRRLLVERLGHLGVGVRERSVLLLQFREQPHVLDGDHGLGGKGLEQCDLPVRERPHVEARHGDGADRFALSKHRDRQTGPEACVDKGRRGVLRVGRHVRNVDNHTRGDCARGCVAAARGDGEDPLHCRELLAGIAVGRLQVDQGSVEPVDVRVSRFAHSRGIRRDGLEDRANVRR